jgi:hypothetical protein
MEGLPHLETMLTNFNKIVSQEGLINKVSVCFDLPVFYYQCNKLLMGNYFAKQSLLSKPFQPQSSPFEKIVGEQNF